MEENIVRQTALALSKEKKMLNRILKDIEIEKSSIVLDDPNREGEFL